MHGLAAAELLDLWERVSRYGPHERALHLLAWALPEHQLETLADFDLGLRDWHLLRLCHTLFGSLLAAYADCPHCGERMEIALDARALQSETPLPPPPLYTDRNGHRYRLANSQDLISIAHEHDVDACTRKLLARCCLDQIDISDLDFDEIDEGLATLANERNLHLDVSCASCGGTWSLYLDSGAFVWEEIDACAAVLLEDVHRLAAVYGWTERDILALSDARRAIYLNRVS